MICENCDICKTISEKEEILETSAKSLSLEGYPPNTEGIKLLIVGETPYPTHAVENIAFCKRNRKEQVEYNCSGRFVLCSLGVDFTKVTEKFNNPQEMFSVMSELGVVFQNAYLDLNSDNSPSRKSRNQKIDTLIQNSNKVVLCGRETHNLSEDVPGKIFKVIHPAARCKSYCKEWMMYWGSRQNLLKVLEPDGSGPIHIAISRINHMGVLVDRLPKHLYYSDGAENEVKTLFILESPGKIELEHGFPCIKSTGEIMSKRLFKCGRCSDIAFGLLIQNRVDDVKYFAIFDTFKFPLDKKDMPVPDTLGPDEVIWQGLKSLETKSWNQCKKKECHSAKITNEIIKIFRQNQDVFNDYKLSLDTALIKFEHLEEIVVCGFIAQCMFKECYSLNDWPYNKWIRWLHGKNYFLRFVKHPSSCYDKHGSIIMKNGVVDWNYTKHGEPRL